MKTILSGRMVRGYALTSSEAATVYDLLIDEADEAEDEGNTEDAAMYRALAEKFA